ncbi:3'-tRNA processing endonuclease Trz2 [Schizosaccharomyces cryophilus OY26]|uniref:ribonuclease Z n=1 Tax=Schizosaccharomyces cryophilus (strain OY26 / ATCC MYA-4695 / CBS 11777 / NBRC 106824 / NRRL Y48691) TaxID=653667 RepID=S9W6M9_SCHCR|nr:3'-tRNA processing endonuclease Trz2 [Schizosaccharomyces cryophilus OY26]EPY54194.1 3'-tRNA processing endonuclease Trz2 [Schizosaccharomyces cryophilus OY26]
MSKNPNLRATKNFYLQFLTVNSRDTSVIPCVHLFFDSKRYIFGSIGEGCQRAILSQQLKLSKIKDVFLCHGGRMLLESPSSSLSSSSESISSISSPLVHARNDTKVDWWDSCGGLIGFLLSMNDACDLPHGESPFTLHGPSEIHYYLSCMRHFTYHTNVDLTIEGYTSSEAPEYADENIRVTPVVISLPSGGRKRKYSDSRTSSNTDITSTTSDSTPHWFSHSSNETAFVVDNALYNTPPPLENQSPQIFISYIVQSHPSLGKFDAKKAKSLGITKGTDYGKLAKGESITLENGSTVYPDDVIGPPVPGSTFFFIHCTHASLIDSLIQQPQWANAPEPICIIHSVSEDVYNNQKYQKWISSLSTKATNILSPTKPIETINYPRSSSAITALNMLDDTSFPLGKNCYHDNLDTLKRDGYVIACPKMKFMFGKKPGIEYPEPGLDVSQLRQNILEEKPDYKHLLTKAQLLNSSLNLPKDFAGSDIQFSTLGTGSAMPSLYRNVSSTYVKIPKVRDSESVEASSYTNNILLDCGEGTLGRLARQYGDCLNDEISSLKWIYISHMHADHHAGVIGVLRLWFSISNTSSKLFLSGPPQFESWLKDYSKLDKLDLSRIVFLSNSATRRDRTFTEVDQIKYQMLIQELDLAAFETVAAVHCPFSYCMQFTGNEGWKIAYSGDTRPSEEFIDIGKDATVVIHEATLEDSMQEIAVRKQHSTYSEALGVGQSMNAKNIILTHFSQRYPKLPDVKLTDKHLNVALAFDGMCLKVYEIPKFRNYIQPLAYLFADDDTADN